MSIRGVQVSDRDLKLFEGLFRYGYLTIEHIANYIYQTSKNAAGKRLIKLRRSGLIRSVRRRDGLGTYCYLPVINKLNHLVNEDVASLGDLVHEHAPWLRLATRHEDLIRTYVLMTEMALPGTDIIVDCHKKKESYNQYGRGPDKIPDITIKSPYGPKLDIEVELNMKTKRRYWDKFYALFSRPPGNFLFICGDDTVKKRLTFVMLDIIGRCDYNENSKSKISIVTADKIKTEHDFVKIYKDAISYELSKDPVTVEYLMHLRELSEHKIGAGRVHGKPSFT